MLTQERRSKIIEIVINQGSVTVTQLAEMFDTSESTIRRDLADLANIGKVKKVHGGAIATNQEFVNAEDSMDVKYSKNMEAKDKIAKYAADQITDDDFVFIDAGSSTFLMTKYLKDSKASFVTNGIDAANALARQGCKVMILGGKLKSTTDAIIGLVAAKNLQKYNFSKAFIGTNGVSEKSGFSTPDTEEAMLKAVAIERSFVSYVLADSTKFNRVSAVTFAPIDASAIICEKCNDADIKKRTVVKEVS